MCHLEEEESAERILHECEGSSIADISNSRSNTSDGEDLYRGDSIQTTRAS